MTDQMTTDAARARDLALRMVAFRSETGTSGEASFSSLFLDLLAENPYFRDHPEDIRIIDSHGDPMTRNIVAVVRGSGQRALVLAGHFDTVSTENYHDLRDISCDADALRDALIADLSSRPLNAQEARALEDLQSGDFLPGRGMLDMKSGLAAMLVCAERFARDPARIGNLVLVATPDEERESRGMRSLRTALPAVVADWGLEIAGAINMDVTSDQGMGEEGRAVYAGTIGKLLPFALVMGISSHAAYPFEGVSAQGMAAAILSRMEANADLADRDHADVSPAPICLEARDLRDGYEVTTPERFWLAFNWLYHSMDADTLFQRFRTEVEAGAAQAMDHFAESSEKYGKMTAKSAGAVPPAPRIVTFAELRAEAARRAPDFAERYAQKEAELAHIDNPLSLSRQLTEWMCDVAQLKGPAIVIGFAGLHYPASRLDPAERDDIALTDAINAARAQYDNRPEAGLVWKPYFQGISDMSFLGQAATGRSVVADNTPISRLIDNPPTDALRFPSVNIGPWGREFHQRLERVYTPYAFGILPDLITTTVKNFLSNKAAE